MIQNLNKSFLSRVEKIHFVGIGGIGMSGIAEVLHSLGFKVSGSDVVENSNIKKLMNYGIDINIGHHGDAVIGKNVVVVSSAIDENNPELINAKNLDIPVVQRAEMLAEIMRFKLGIGVTGTHGKTTTTSMIANILSFAKLDPTYVIGGIVKSLGSNASLGEGDYFVAEADESDGSFLRLTPLVAVITNIDKDHLENFNNDFENLKEAFVDFAHKTPFYGIVVLGIDDPVVKEIANKIARNKITYGFDKTADVSAKMLEQDLHGSKIQVTIKKDKFSSIDENITFTYNLPCKGKHNALNALAAITVCLELEISLENIIAGLSNYSGVERRMQSLGIIKGPSGSVEIIDDYGHHPVEIEAVADALSTHCHQKQLITIFQPHRFSRTLNHFENFALSLGRHTDKLFLMDIYPASEKPIKGITSEALARLIKEKYAIDVEILPKDPKTILNKIYAIAKDGDIVLFQGAGDISKIAHETVGLSKKA